MAKRSTATAVGTCVRSGRVAVLGADVAGVAGVSIPEIGAATVMEGDT
jgi:hypothetical protein